MADGAFTDPKFFGYLGSLNPNPHVTHGHNSYRRITGATDSKVTLQNRSGKKAKSVSIDKLSRKGAIAAIKAGGDIGAKVAAERPVYAARLATYASPQEKAAAIKAAKEDPNSARSERRARRGKGAWKVG